MDIQVLARCASGVAWSTSVRSKTDSHKFYRVQYSVFHSSRDVEYDYTCTCPAFTHHSDKYCKHIIDAKQDHCNWDQLVDGGTPVNGNCPQCGEHAEYYRAAV
jgi:hypothetical protein